MVAATPRRPTRLPSHVQTPPQVHCGQEAVGPAGDERLLQLLVDEQPVDELARTPLVNTPVGPPPDDVTVPPIVSADYAASCVRPDRSRAFSTSTTACTAAPAATLPRSSDSPTPSMRRLGHSRRIQTKYVVAQGATRTTTTALRPACGQEPRLPRRLTVRRDASTVCTWHRCRQGAGRIGTALTCGNNVNMASTCADALRRCCALLTVGPKWDAQALGHPSAGSHAGHHHPYTTVQSPGRRNCSDVSTRWPTSPACETKESRCWCCPLRCCGG